jgi:general L-amino acid transport system permease protein
MQDTFQPLAPRPMPGKSSGAVAWLKANLFSSPTNSMMTLIMLAAVLFSLSQATTWSLTNAVFGADLEACNKARGLGACWGVIAEKGRLILLGLYPQEEQWRPIVATLLMLGVVALSCMPAFWNKSLLIMWPGMLVVYFTLMKGGVLGLAPVSTDQWGGLPLTVMLTVIAMTLAFPLAILVALGRRSHMPAIRTLCTLYVELIRGVPLITVLFMASFMLPLFMPPGTNIDVLIRVVVGITLFSAAYMAEVVRGGLQALPKGQTEAAATLGLTNAAQDRLAAGADHGGAVAHEHLHRHVQGHLAGHHRVALRPDGGGRSRAELRRRLAPVQDGRSLLHCRDLFRFLLRHVALQPVG